MMPTHPPHFQINISTEFVTAVTFFFYCRLFFPPKSLTAFAFSSIADYFPPKSLTAFAFSSIADYFFRHIYDCIRIFLLLRIIFPPKSLTAFAFSSIADYFSAISVTTFAFILNCRLSPGTPHICLLSAYRQGNPVYGQEYS